MRVTLQELAIRLQGQLHHRNPELIVDNWCLDSRDVHQNSVFLAIRGERVDGHDFALRALAAGAVVCVVERPIEGPHILVNNLVDALATMAKSWRNEFNRPVVGVTGSVGKTTAKELIAVALAQSGPVLKSEGNQNTEFTSPLVWSHLTPEHQFADIEMAMRGSGQIAHLASFSQPTIAVITNIGNSHLEMMGSREAIFSAKTEIFGGLTGEKTAVIWAEDDYLVPLKKKAPGKVVTFGFSDQADSRITGYEILNETHSAVEGVCLGTSWKAELPVIGRQMALAASLAVLVAHECGVSVEEASSGLGNVVLPGLRMQVRHLSNGAVALVDSYNANPASMKMALETLTAFPSARRRFAALAAMRELGPDEESAHRQLGSCLKELHLEGSILLGEPMRFAMEKSAPNDHISMANSLDDIRAFVNSLEEGDVVLVKGSRTYELEKALTDSYLN